MKFTYWTFEIGPTIRVHDGWTSTSVCESTEGIYEIISVWALNNFEVNASDSHTSEQYNPALQMLSTLLDECGTDKIYPTTGEWRLQVGCSRHRQVSHERKHEASVLDLTVEAFAQNSSYCSSTVDDPELLSKVGKYMLGWNMTIATMFVVDDECCDWVTFGQN